ncbi:hypothetical protein GRX01_06635 [Halobaculum sp. WSA2]|uniref:Uncharacterized protein n=1 Tax=Halobaculum saliterrae TaxID=2073113 RepID=A0A6B0SR66_9EURY|nr:hypothetical protein [Halobaculum saliterrae]MXR41017.1 hypothetical protein [Halobaculum saliterrae]
MIASKDIVMHEKRDLIDIGLILVFFALFSVVLIQIVVEIFGERALDAGSVIISGSLSLLLIYFYRQQSDIARNQEEIMRSQQVMKEREIRPIITHSKPFFVKTTTTEGVEEPVNFTKVYINLKNDGQGEALNICYTLNIDSTNELRIPENPGYEHVKPIIENKQAVSSLNRESMGIGSPPSIIRPGETDLFTFSNAIYGHSEKEGVDYVVANHLNDDYTYNFDDGEVLLVSLKITFEDKAGNEFYIVPLAVVAEYSEGMTVAELVDKAILAADFTKNYPTNYPGNPESEEVL